MHVLIIYTSWLEKKQVRILSFLFHLLSQPLTSPVYKCEYPMPITAEEIYQYWLIYSKFI